MEKIPPSVLDDKNVFQKVSDATGTIVTPANLIDIVAFGIAFEGIREHDTWSGIAKSSAGYIADAIDGRVARATKTQSALGEAIDAAGDKIKLVYALSKIWESQRAPRPLIAAIALQNTANAAITIYDRAANETPQVHPTKAGKHSFAMQEFGIGFNVIGSKVAESAPRVGRAIKVAGSMLGWAGVVRGFVQSTPDYWRQANSWRNNAKHALKPVTYAPRSLPGN